MVSMDKRSSSSQAPIFVIKKVLISDNLADVCAETLRAGGIEVDCKQKLPKEELCKIIGEYDGLVVRSDTKVTKEVLDAATNLKLIGRAGVGVDNIDVAYATKKGVIVMNTPGGNTVSAAEHTCALMQALARNIPQAAGGMANGKWDRKKYMGFELNGKTLGIIGLGRIGREVASRMQAFGMKTVGYDPMLPAEKASEYGIKFYPLDDLWQHCDFISVHTPLTEGTRNMVNKETIAKCKKGVYFINVARGGIINEAEMLEMIEGGHCGGAGLDVFPTEPPADLDSNPLFKHPKVICTPHLGASTKEAQDKVAEEIAEAFVAASKGGELLGVVNAPALTKAFAPDLKPWIELGIKMGALAAQNTGKSAQIKSLTVGVYGLKSQLSSLTSAVTCGFMHHVSTQSVNLVNAQSLAEEKGFTISQTVHNNPHTMVQQCLEIRVDTTNGTSTYEGTVYGNDSVRLIRVDDFDCEVSPSGFLLLYRNQDVPGTLAKVTTILGDANINIGDFSMGRKNKEALCILTTDSDINQDVLDKIVSTPNIISAKSMTF
eukprot:Clim_evm9s2 gene=Clim_evmTU9s2